MKSVEKMYSYTAVIQQDKEGNHLVSFPSLPGCFTFGKTHEEAVRMGQEVLELWIEEMTESRKTIPNEQLSSVTVLQAPRPALRQHSHKKHATAKRQRA